MAFSSTHSSLESGSNMWVVQEAQRNTDQWLSTPKSIFSEGKHLHCLRAARDHLETTDSALLWKILCSQLRAFSPLSRWTHTKKDCVQSCGVRRLTSEGRIGWLHAAHLGARTLQIRVKKYFSHQNRWTKWRTYFSKFSSEGREDMVVQAWGRRDGK